MVFSFVPRMTEGATWSETMIRACDGSSRCSHGNPGMQSRSAYPRVDSKLRREVRPLGCSFLYARIVNVVQETARVLWKGVAALGRVVWTDLDVVVSEMADSRGDREGLPGMDFFRSA
jgi:hypothetical protein